MQFKHFLITRFNLRKITTPQKRWSNEILHKSEVDSLNPGWLKYRLDLFFKYCYPSVNQQDTRRFQWLILMDDRTPEEIALPLREAVAKHDNYTLWMDRAPDIITAPKAIMACQGSKEFVISTALDSDDAISTNYLRTIQNKFRGKREFINVVKGVVMAHHKGYQYIGNRTGRTVNHFRSFVEKKNNIYSVYGISHGSSEDLAPVHHLTDTHAEWLEVIHGDNCSNRFKKARHDKTRPFDEISASFGIEPKTVENPYPIDRMGFIIDESWGRVL